MYASTASASFSSPSPSADAASASASVVSSASPWTILVHGLSSQPSSLSFVSGGAEMEAQDLPEFLHPYHAKSIEMTDAAFADPSLVCTRAVS